MTNIIVRRVEINYKCGHAATLAIQAFRDEQVERKVRFFEALVCPACREKRRDGCGKKTRRVCSEH